MPLARYFLYVGGVLLTLVFILDACLTKLPVMESAHVNSPIIRIRSDRKWPERIVFDKAFALMQPSNAKRLEPSAPGRRELKPQRQRKIVKRHVMPRSLLVARQPQFGWFGNTIW